MILLCNFVPEAANAIKDNLGGDGLMKINVSVAVNIAFYLWCFWLARRVADSKSNGTLYIVLLIVGIVGKIITAIMNRSLVGIVSTDFVVDAMGLYYLMKVREDQ